MPLDILIILVVGGIGAIAVLLHLSGRSERCALRDAEEAAQVWRDSFDALDPRAIELAHDGHAARIDTERGTGLVWAMGQDFCARLLPSQGVRITRRPGALILALPDFTAPRIRLTLTDDELARWQAALDPTGEQTCSATRT